MTSVFLIAGFTKQTAEDDKFRQLRKAIELKGYKLIPVPIKWSHKTVAQYSDEFKNFYQQKKGKHNIVIGNSYGAMVAFLTAPDLMPDEVILCSLSPYFKEDVDKTTKQYRIKRFGKRREQGMQLLSAKDTAKRINDLKIPVTLLYGELEKTIYPHLLERVKATANDLEDCELVELPKATHSFYEREYVQGIEKIL